MVILKKSCTDVFPNSNTCIHKEMGKAISMKWTKMRQISLPIIYYINALGRHNKQ